MGFGADSGISWTICKQSAPRSGQITTQSSDRCTAEMWPYVKLLWPLVYNSCLATILPSSLTTCTYYFCVKYSPFSLSWIFYLSLPLYIRHWFGFPSDMFYKSSTKVKVNRVWQFATRLTSSLNSYKPVALPDAQATVLKHWKHIINCEEIKKNKSKNMPQPSKDVVVMIGRFHCSINQQLHENVFLSDHINIASHSLIFTTRFSSTADTFNCHCKKWPR